jgi:RNA polymerase sigma-70 factor, ECF subfamily
LRTLLKEERKVQLRQAVRDLPGQMRGCLTLRLHHELSYQEIATIMKLSPETVKAHLARGRKRLRRELSNGEPEGPAASKDG